MAGTRVAEGLPIANAGSNGGFDGDAGDDHFGDRPFEVPRRAYYTGLSLGLAAIVMFFMALTSSYIVRRGIGGDWQPVELPRILWLNTLVLIASSGALELARRSFSRDDRSRFRRWWGVSAALGFVFLAGQFVAWQRLAAAGVYLTTNPSSSFFYLLTAAHGVHLLGGLVVLLYVAARQWSRLQLTRGLVADLASIYWHFMGGLWVFLFLLMYLGR